MNALSPSRVESQEKQIATRAYELWLAEGRPEGKAADHWHLAENELLVQTPDFPVGRLLTKAAIPKNAAREPGRQRRPLP